MNSMGDNARFRDYCEVCENNTYVWYFETSKISVQAVQKLYNRNFHRVAFQFRLFDYKKGCCMRFNTRIKIQDFKPRNQDLKVLKRFNKFLYGEYSLNPKQEEEKKGEEQKSSQFSPLKEEIEALFFKMKLWLSLSKEQKEIVPQALKKHKISNFKGNKSCSSNLALVLYHSLLKQSGHTLEEIQKQICSQMQAESGISKNFQISSHLSGLLILKNKCVSVLPKISETKEKNKSSKQQDQEQKHTTNLKDYFQQFVPLDPKRLKHSYKVKITRALTSDEKYHLFQKYYDQVHKKECPNRPSWDGWICQSPVYDPDDQQEAKLEPKIDTSQRDQNRIEKDQGVRPQFLGTYHMLHYIDSRIVAVGLIDLLPTMVVSIQFFYDPEYRRLSLGRVGALREIEWVHKLIKEYKLPIHHYALQDYSPKWKNFLYKVDYPTTEILCPVSQAWIPYHKEITEMMGAKEWNISKSSEERPSDWLEEATQYFEDHAYYNSSRGGFRKAKGNFHPAAQQSMNSKFQNIFREIGPGIHDMLQFIYFFYRKKEE